MPELKKFEWDFKMGPQKLWTNLQRDGIAWFHMPGSAALAKKNRNQFVESLLRVEPKKVEWFEVKVVEGTTSYRTTNQEALFHTDSSSHPQPDLQVMACQRKAKKGGKSRFVDTWKVLDEIERKDPDLYSLLFTRERPIFSIGEPFWSPTFYARGQRFVCTYVPQLADFDLVGKTFVKWVNRQDVIELQMEPDDVYVANNLRMLHARTAFVGNDRLYYRMLTTLARPLDAKIRHAKRAQKVARVLSNLSGIFAE